MFRIYINNWTLFKFGSEVTVGADRDKSIEWIKAV